MKKIILTILLLLPIVSISNAAEAALRIDVSQGSSGTDQIEPGGGVESGVY